MYEQQPNQSWIFLIKTDSYAGNFERDMCAYITGMVGECGVGAEEAQLFYQEMGLVEHLLDEGEYDWDGIDVKYNAEDFENPFALAVESRADEHGCRRPTSLWPAEINWVAIFFEQKPTDEMIEIMRSRAAKFCREYCPTREHKWDRHKIKILGYELLREEMKQFQERSWPS